MPSRTVSNKWKSCMFVVSAYKVHREPVLTGVAEISKRDPLPATPPPDQEGQVPAVATVAPSFFFQPETTSIEEAKERVGWFLDSVVDAMERRAVAMVEADEATRMEKDEASGVREDRDRVASELRGQYVRQRDALIKLHDERVAKMAGFETTVEQEPSPLTLQVRRAINRLKSGEVVFEKTFAGIRIDAVEYGKELEPLLEELETIMRGLDVEVRETEGMIQAKADAIAAHDLLFIPGAQCIEAAFKMAGMPELAKKVRPSVRRAGRLVEEVEAEEEGREVENFADLGVPVPTMPAPAESADD